MEAIKAIAKKKKKGLYTITFECATEKDELEAIVVVPINFEKKENKIKKK
jgi:hypothetical protein